MEQNYLDDYQRPQVSYVGLWPRFGALMIDGIILAVFNYSLGYLLNDGNNPLPIILTSVLPLLYNPILEYMYGATLGKMALGIKIVNYDLEKLTITNVVMRNMIYIGIELITLSGSLYGLYRFNDNAAGGFAGLSDTFSPAFTLTSIIGISVFGIYIVELVFLLTDERHRALHDRIGKTYVVRKF
jgi:uncharacterized RDD family membrane protein YckC